jgi:hypothetical protein
MPPPSLNVEYILYRAWQMLSSIPIDHNVGGPVGFGILLFWIVAITGLMVAFILLVGIVYVRVRLIQVEHFGFHAKEEEEHMKFHQTEAIMKNARWEMIVNLSNSENESDWRRAILEADIMLGDLLDEKGYVGETIGEQLKGANPEQFTTVNYAWEAHRVRNAVAHLGEAFPLSERDMHNTIDNYQRVFEEFEYI